jgi:hypothetical protein
MPSFSDHVEVPKRVLVRFVEKESVFLNLETEWYAHVASCDSGADN